jgi:SHS2 domain-containing protein
LLRDRARAGGGCAREPPLTYRLVPHTADIAAELRAADEPGLRAAGIEALRELLVGDSPVRALAERPIEPRGADAAERLVHFLGDVLYLYDTERFVPARATPAGVLGEPFDAARHHAQREVKAVTHHGAQIRQENDGLHAIIVFDV